MTKSKLATLGSVAKFIRGITFKPDELVEVDTSDAVVCMRTKNIQANLDESDRIAVPPRLVKRQEQYLQTGDILVSTANSWDLVGKCCWVGPLQYPATAGGFISILRANPFIVDPSYLFHWMRSPETVLRLRHCGRQTTNISNMSFERAESLEIPLPPLPEQKRIADILDKADAIRRKRAQALELTDQFLQSVFLDMFGDPVTNPKGWEVARLDSLTEIASGVTKGRKFNGKKTVMAPYMRVASVQDGYLVTDNITEVEVLPEDVEKYRLLHGDLLLTEGGDPDKLGRGAVWRNAVPDCIHQNHIFRVRPDQNCLAPEFLSMLVGSARGKRYFLSAAKQTTGIASINMTQLRGLPILVPPIELQCRFAHVVEMKKRLAARLMENSRACNELFGSLVQRAFGGEL